MAQDNQDMVNGTGGSGGMNTDWDLDVELDLDDLDSFLNMDDDFWTPQKSGAPDAPTNRIPPVSASAPQQSREQSREQSAHTQQSAQREPRQLSRKEQRRERRRIQREEDREDRRVERDIKRRHHRVPGFIKFILYMMLIIGGSVLLATYGWRWANDVLALNKDPVTTTIVLTSESTVDEVTSELENKGLIEYPWLFKLYCKITGSEDKFSFGSFEVNTDMDYHALVSALSSSSTTMQTTEVTVPEGYTVDQIFQLLVDSGVCETVTELQETAATHDYAFDFLQDLPLGDYHRLEGYLFPDTYQFYLGQDPLYVINKMLVNFDDKVTQEMRDTAVNMGYTLHQMVIISSLIEKESNGTDQRNIASVIYNRLNSSVTQGLLQFDSTIQYILELQGGERKDQLTEADLAIDSAYNTYLYAGLPAGPICNAGLDCIQAALNPNETDYIYFLQDNSGNSYFYNNYEDFIEGKNLYLTQGYVPEEEDETNYEDFSDAG